MEQLCSVPAKCLEHSRDRQEVAFAADAQGFKFNPSSAKLGVRCTAAGDTAMLHWYVEGPTQKSRQERLGTCHPRGRNDVQDMRSAGAAIRHDDEPENRAFLVAELAIIQSG